MLKILEFIEIGEYETAWSLAVATGREERLVEWLKQEAERLDEKEYYFLQHFGRDGEQLVDRLSNQDSIEEITYNILFSSHDTNSKCFTSKIENFPFDVKSSNREICLWQYWNDCIEDFCITNEADNDRAFYLAQLFKDKLQDHEKPNH